MILWGNAAMAMRLTPARVKISRRHLRGRGVPNGAKSLVLIIDDPDAPDPKAPKMVWVHWVDYNIPPDTKSLTENAGKARLPSALLGLNDFKKTGMAAPDRPAPLLP
jgi:hypothetical protein